MGQQKPTHIEKGEFMPLIIQLLSMLGPKMYYSRMTHTIFVNVIGVRVQFLSVTRCLNLKGDIQELFEVIETEPGAIALGTGLILEWSREGRREERSVPADVLPGRRLDVAASKGATRRQQVYMLEEGREMSKHIAV